MPELVLDFNRLKSPQDVWTYVTRSLTDKAGFGLEKLGASSLKGTTGLDLAAGASGTVLSITGSGIVSIIRGASGSVVAKVVIDGVLQPSPLNDSGGAATSTQQIGTYYGKPWFMFPLIRFKSSFLWSERNIDTVTQSVYYTYAYALFGSKVEKEEVEEDTANNIRYKILYYDTGAVVKYAVGNITPPPPPPKVPTLEERIAALETKVDKILTILTTKTV